MSDEKYVVMVAGIVAAGREDYAADYFRRMAEVSKQDAGCLIYNIHQSADNPSEFMMYSVWENKAAFEQHNQREGVQEFKQELNKTMLETQSSMTEWVLLGQKQ